ncbi:MAG: hypothetical protein WDW38_008043 [Sanguina aurantia]
MAGRGREAVLPAWMTAPGPHTNNSSISNLGSSTDSSNRVGPPNGGMPHLHSPQMQQPGQYPPQMGGPGQQQHQLPGAPPMQQQQHQQHPMGQPPPGMMMMGPPGGLPPPPGMMMPGGLQPPGFGGAPQGAPPQQQQQPPHGPMMMGMPPGGMPPGMPPHFMPGMPGMPPLMMPPPGSMPPPHGMPPQMQMGQLRPPPQGGPMPQPGQPGFPPFFNPAQPQPQPQMPAIGQQLPGPPGMPRPQMMIPPGMQLTPQMQQQQLHQMGMMMPPQQLMQQPSAQQLQAPTQQPAGPAAATAVMTATAAAPAVAGSSAEGKLKKDWTEHIAPDKRKYFYNTVTKQSSWERPVEEKVVPVAAVAAAATPAAAAAAATPAAAVVEPFGGWKEYTSPDGRSYYYNKGTKESRWTMPEEMKAHGGSAAAGSVQVVSLASSAAADKDSKAASQEGSKAVKAESTPAAAVTPAAAPEDPNKYVFATKAEAKDVFKELLASVKCASEWTWEQAMRVIVNDPRYAALKQLGEKKQAFNEYVQQRKNDEKEEDRKRARAAKEDYCKMLAESGELKVTHGYRKAKELFEDDSRWKAVPERDREELFHDAQKERDKREKEERKADRKRKAVAFKELLANTSGIKATSEWRKVGKRLEGEEAFEELDKIERLEVFQEHLRDLERLEREEKERAKEEVKREERRARDVFKDLLRMHRDEGMITVKTRWREYADVVKREEAFLTVEANTSGSRPKELFEDLIEEMEAEWDKAKALLKQCVKEHNVEVGPTTSFDAFFTALEPAAEQVKSVHESNIRAFFDESLGRAKLRAAEEAERRRKGRDKLASFLRHARGLREDTEWESFAALNEKEPEMRMLPPGETQEMFEEFVAKLKAKAADRARERGEDAVKDGGGGRDRNGDEVEGDERSHKRSKKSKSSRREHEDEEERRKDSKKHRKDKERSGGGGSERPNGASHADPAYSAHAKDGSSRDANGGRSGRVAPHEHSGPAPTTHHSNHPDSDLPGNGNGPDAIGVDGGGGGQVILPGPPPLQPEANDAAAAEAAAAAAAAAEEKPVEEARSAGGGLVAYEDDVVVTAATRGKSEDRDSGEIREDGERR